jgi:hypothetical protein
MNVADWSFWTPAEPMEPDGVLIKGERKRLIHGIASTESEDKHGEEMVLAGMDFTPYLESGHLNDDHMPGEQHILGRPIEAQIVEDAGAFKKSLKGKSGFYQVCELYDTEPGRAVWDNMRVEKNDPKRQRGFSVEGAILATKLKKLLKTLVEDCALTRKPANTDTFASLVKSLATNTSSALEVQNLDDGEETDDMKQALDGFADLHELLWGDCKHNCYDSKGRFRKGARSALFHLVKCRGANEDEAFKFVKQLKHAGYLK